MNSQDVFAMAVLLQRQRRRKRLMQESLVAYNVALRVKARERSMLKRIKQGMLAKEAARKKLVDDFMEFIGAPSSKDLENAQKFDEKAMMNNILNTMSSGCSENGGFAVGYGDSNVLGINLGLVEKARMDAIEAPLNSVASYGVNNGGSVGGHGGTSNAAENTNNLGKEGVMTPSEGTSSNDDEGSNAGSYDGGNRRN